MKTVVLLSGGMDSVTLLHYVHQRLGATAIHALSYHYGQRHERELAAAEWQAARLPAVARWLTLDLTSYGHAVAPATALAAAGAAVPDLAAIPAAQLDQPITYVPHRNLILLSLAAGYAESIGAATVYYGAQAQDEYGYWDCTAEFVSRLNHLLSLNRRTSVTIQAPFTTLRKADVLRLGRELGVDYAHTWTCYRGGELSCGVCPSCVERRRAFAEVGAADPLPYDAP
jgi:7-cyano-7-deazaguanine synthase